MTSLLRLRRMKVGWGLALAGAIVLCAGAPLAAQASPSAPVLTSATGDADGYITATWTPPPDTSSFSFIAFWTGTSSRCDSQGPGQGCMLFSDNGNENVNVGATTHKSEETYEPGTTEWVQVCYFEGGVGYYCSNSISVLMPAARAATTTTTTSSGETGTTGGIPITPPAVNVTLSTTATLVHADGTQETVVKGKTIGLVVGEALRAGTKAAHLAIKEGRFVIAPGTDLSPLGGPWLVSPSPSSAVGEAWFQGQGSLKHYLVVDAGTWKITATAAVTFVVENQGHRDEIQAISGKVDVQPTSAGAPKKKLVLLPGFETFTINTGYFHAPTTPTRFKPPASPFWN